MTLQGLELRISLRIQQSHLQSPVEATAFSVTGIKVAFYNSVCPFSGKHKKPLMGPLYLYLGCQQLLVSANLHVAQEPTRWTFIWSDCLLSPPTWWCSADTCCDCQRTTEALLLSRLMVSPGPFLLKDHLLQDSPTVRKAFLYIWKGKFTTVCFKYTSTYDINFIS